jgi:hypothetical protein
VITSPTACARSSSATISAEVRTTLRRANGTPRAWGPSAHLAGNSPLTSAKIRGASFIAIASWRALYGATGLPRICLTTRLLFRAKQNRGRSDRAQKIVRWNNCVLSLEWQSHSGQCAQRLQGLWDLLKRPPRPFQSILSILTLSETCLIQHETPTPRPLLTPAGRTVGVDDEESLQHESCRGIVRAPRRHIIFAQHSKSGGQ